MTDCSKLEPTAVIAMTENARAFAAWAEVYDNVRNPLTALEERYLALMLPEVRDADVLDVGCGTGRWLSHLALRLPRSLQGVDTSPGMLRQAANKRIAGARLSLASGAALPQSNDTADLILSSFVASYVEDSDAFARELYRVVRKGGNVFVTDMHPETATLLGWQRSFRARESTVQLRFRQRSVQEVVAAFRQAGFSFRALLAPSFGDAERPIFAAQDKLERFEEAAHHPAIYLLHLHKPKASLAAARGDAQRSLRLEGAVCALGPREAVQADLQIEHNRIMSLGSEAGLDQQHTGQRHTEPAATRMDLSGFVLLPGLINAHDHLEFALFPRLGAGPYGNATEWAQDIQLREVATITLHKSVSKDTRLWWGAVRNLLCGVTTVCHHNPMDALLHSEAYPLRVVARFGWEHSLAFSLDIPHALQQTPADAPFILHACEGIDAISAGELRKLDELGALEERTVLVHALAIDEQDLAFIKARGASVVLCPSSNRFLFSKVPSGDLVRMLPKVALGSDSPLTAAGDLLDEIRFASRACGIGRQHLYRLVTTEPAAILRLRDGEGTMQPGGRADLIAVRQRPGDPAEILAALTWWDIELVLVGGRVQLASEEVFRRLCAADREGLVPLLIARELRWLRAPVAEMLREAEAVLGEGRVRVGGLPVSCAGCSELPSSTDGAQSPPVGSRYSADVR